MMNLKSLLEVLEVSWNLIVSVDITNGTSSRASGHKILLHCSWLVISCLFTCNFSHYPPFRGTIMCWCVVP